MISIVKSITNCLILLAVLGIVLGVVFIVDPEMSIIALGSVIAVYLIVQGIALIILDIKAKRLFIPFEGLLKGILSVILGVLLLKYPDSMVAYLGIVLGIYIIVHSVSGIKLASALRFTGAHWVLMIIMNILNIILGCFILYSPVFGALSITVYVGIVLIVYSIINIVYMIIIKKNSNDVAKLIADKRKVVEVNAEEEGKEE